MLLALQFCSVSVFAEHTSQPTNAVEAAKPRGTSDPERRASARSENFIVVAENTEFAEEVAQAAEKFRKSLATEWLGKELPRASEPSVIRVNCQPNFPGHGRTDLRFFLGFRGAAMEVNGCRKEILDSVVPHEVFHVVLATHFGSPVPRWADEGLCTTVECEADRAKMRKLLVEFLYTNRGIAFRKMVEAKDYPRDMLPIYAQGQSVVEYLVQMKDKKTFIAFLGQAIKEKEWEKALRDHYEIASLDDFQVNWLEWVRASLKQR